MNLKRIEVYLNDQWKDISSNIDTKQKIKIITRCDEAFAIGSFVAWLDRNTNIPPYTPLKITFIDNSTEMHCCSSVCKRYLANPSLYVHEIELLDKSAWMSCWILGSKNFSAQTAWPEDWKKMYKIYAIMTEKYGVTYSRSGWDTKFTQNQEFTFGPGTTMYDAYCDIMGTYNCKPIITKWEPENNKFTIGYKDLTASTEYVINDSNVLYTEMRQDVDTYGSSLESEVANVIDRDNTAKVSNLSTRHNTVQMTADNAMLFLPNKIEKITKFGITFRDSMYLDFMNLDLNRYFWRYINDTTGEIELAQGTEKTFYQWCLDTIPLGNGDITLSPLYSLIMHAAEKDANINIGKLSYQVFVFSCDDEYARLAGQADSYILDISDRILEEAQYNCLEAKEKPKYCFYKTGDNYISGLNERYKDDFWNAILGNKTTTFLGNLKKDYPTLNFEITGSDNTCVLKVNFYETIFKDSYTALYDVEYIPIVNMYMAVNKNVNPLNESSYKHIARSYSNGANFIDFNRLDFSMKKNNDFLGLEELTIEYSIKNSSAPIPGQYINYYGIKWYIASCDRTICKDNDVVVINLVRDYNKIADAIGVKTQFESTKLPLNNVIDRHIYKKSDSYVDIFPDIYAKVQFGSNTLYKRATALKGENKGVYVTFEAQDNYVFDRKAVPTDKGNLYEIIDIPYADSNNEQVSYSISLCRLNGLSLTESFNLPMLSSEILGKVEMLNTSDNVLVYKDAREKLVFTLYYPNALLFEDVNTRRVKVKVTTNSNIKSYSVSRIESKVGANLGEISENTTLYTGDILSVSATTYNGYYIQEYANRIPVYYSNVIINLLAYPQIDALDPVFQNFKLTPLKGTHILEGEILNNNSVRVLANINVYYLVGMIKNTVISYTEYILPGGKTSVYLDAGSWSEYVVKVTYSNSAFKQSPTVTKTVSAINYEDRT